MSYKAGLTDFIEWDVRNWATALEYWKSHSAQGLRGSSVLEVGCGYGGISLWLALEGARVTCTDINGPQERALLRHERGGVRQQIRYEALDATEIPYTEEFDIIVFKSMLGGITDRDLQARAIGQMHKALKPGGELFFAENLTASPVHTFLRRRYVKWVDLWRYVTIAEMMEFLRPFASVQTRTLGVAGTFGRSERQRDLLARVDELVLNRLTPSRWRYIMLGVARK